MKIRFNAAPSVALLEAIFYHEATFLTEFFHEVGNPCSIFCANVNATG